MAKKSNGVVSDRESPNPHVLEAARDYHAAARSLAPVGGQSGRLLPFCMVGGFALEIYLKSLNSHWLYPDMVLPPDKNPDHGIPSGLQTDMYRQTVQAAPGGHDLVKIFDGLDTLTRDEMTRKYAETSPLWGVRTLGEALARYRNIFVHSRYIFEDKHSIPDGPIVDILIFLDFLGDFVEAKHKANPRTIAREEHRRLMANVSNLESNCVEPAEPVVRRGRVVDGAVVLDLGESLPEETIVRVEPADSSSRAESGVVKGGLIQLDWSDSLSNETTVNVVVFGKLLSLEEIDPAFRIGDLAVGTGVSSLIQDLSHQHFDDPEAED